MMTKLLPIGHQIVLSSRLILNIRYEAKVLNCALIQQLYSQIWRILSVLKCCAAIVLRFVIDFRYAID